jgi:hypothetical protein
MLLDRLAPYLIEGATQRGTTRALRQLGHPGRGAAHELANGSQDTMQNTAQNTAQDTAPFA